MIKDLSKSLLGPMSQLQSIRCRVAELSCPFWVGHFSRLSHWKGQHVLLDALALCPQQIGAIFVGDALFGEEDYAQGLQEQVVRLKLCDRVRFLGFQSPIQPLMKVCNLIAHTAIAPEPFGRVIVEGMLCGRPVVATEAGGVPEIVQHERSGWLFPPGDSKRLAEIITNSAFEAGLTAIIARQGQLVAQERFNHVVIQDQIDTLLRQAVVNQ